MLRIDDIETPAYLYDLAEVRRSHHRLTEALPTGSLVYYSVKANPHPDILATLNTLGSRAEVSSTGELSAVLDAGFHPGSVLYTGPGKRDADIAAALRAGVRRFSVDSPYALDQLDRLATAHGVDVACLLRVNPDRPAAGQGLTMSGITSQFGADLSWIEADRASFGNRPRARIVGPHLYFGSNITDEEQLVEQFALAIAVASRLRKVLRIPFEMLDLGGGFGAPFARAGEPLVFSRVADRVGTLLNEAFPEWRTGHPQIAFESGRYLTASCGRLLVRVLDVKRSQGRSVLILESGINHLGGMSGLRRLPEIAPDLGEVTGKEIPDVMVTGPLCTPLDIWARRTCVPDLRPGDLVTVPNVGAYSLSASLVAFLGHAMPLEVTVEDGTVRGVSRLAICRQPATLQIKENHGRAIHDDAPPIPAIQ